MKTFSLKYLPIAAAAVHALIAWLYLYSELNVSHGNTFWKMLVYVPIYLLTVLAYFRIGEFAYSSRETTIGKILYAVYLLFGWIALYWATLSLSLVLMMLASQFASLSWIPATIVIEHASKALAFLACISSAILFLVRFLRPQMRSAK
jgi:hypothetical protein